jgi:hypothetical protein
VLAPRETAIAAAGAYHFASQEGSYESGTLRVRRGLARRVEGSLETTAYYYEEGQGLTAVVLRAGLKYCAAGHDPARCILALTGGAGGGAYDASVLFGADVGLILGWENPYLVPFVGARAGFVVPTSPRPVNDGATCDGCTAVFNTPGPNFAVAATAGLRLPLPFRQPATPGFALIAAYEFLEVIDAQKAETVNVFVGAAEIEF